MKRTTIILPDDLSLLLSREARRTGTSASEITRRALAGYLGGTSEERELPFADLGHSGHHDTARKIDEILAAEWTRARRR